jgi:hypothetical protein
MEEKNGLVNMLIPFTLLMGINRDYAFMDLRIQDQQLLIHCQNDIVIGMEDIR